MQSKSDSLPAAITTLAKKNPLLGSFRGVLDDASHRHSYKINVQCNLNKKGTPALHAQIGVDGFGEVDLDLVPHAHSTGSFEGQLLAERPTDGILSGHITHTGHLVLSISSPGLSFNTGNLKRLTAAAALAQPFGQIPAASQLFAANPFEFGSRMTNPMDDVLSGDVL